MRLEPALQHVCTWPCGRKNGVGGAEKIQDTDGSGKSDNGGEGVAVILKMEVVVI